MFPCRGSMLALTRPPPRAAQDESLPLHLALYGEALDAVVLALLAAYPGAAMERTDVRLPRPLLHRLYARSHSPAATLRRVMSCRCTWPRALARRRRWWRRCSQLTRALSRRRTANTSAVPSQFPRCIRALTRWPPCCAVENAAAARCVWRLQRCGRVGAAGGTPWCGQEGR